MIRLTGSTLFIVGSPFQCLCMLEAIRYFNIKEYDVIVPDDPIKQTIDNVSLLLTKYKISFSICRINHAIKDLLPIIFKKHRHYQNIFIGDYYCPIIEAFSVFYGAKKCNVFFLDDGTQALSLFSQHPRSRFTSKKSAIIFKFYFVIAKLKGFKTKSFFTIYNVNSKEFVIYHNDFTLLKASSSQNRNCCYIIGTNSSILDLKDCTYLSLLGNLVKWIKNTWPYETLYYCPHRRDSCNNDIKNWCHQNDVNWFDTEVSVEYDFVTKGINPICVVGFTSNALYTLKMIYPEADIRTVYYNVNDLYSDLETSVIRHGMNESGIKTLVLE